MVISFKIYIWNVLKLDYGSTSVYLFRKFFQNFDDSPSQLSFKVILLEMLVADLIAMPYTFQCSLPFWTKRNSTINFFVSSFLILVSLYKNKNHRDNVVKSKQEDLRIEQNWALRIGLRCVVHHNKIRKTTWILPQNLKSSITKSKNNI